MTKRLLLLIPLLILAISCNPFASTSSTESGGTAPVIIAFSANPSSFSSGESATLMWNVTGATSTSIDQGIGTVAAAGTTTISPTSTTTYTLTVSNSSGTVSQSFTASVSSSSSSSSSSSTPTSPPVPPPALPHIVIFDISPNTIHVPPGPGPYKAIMRWEVNNATNVTIDGSPVPLAGSRDLTPSVGAHTYTIRATNSLGVDTRSQVLHVTP